MNVVWTKSSVSDLVHIREYIEIENPTASSKIANLILETVEQLIEFPNLGRPGRVRGTRELVISNTPYLIPYRIQNEEIQLLRVLHGRQDYP